MSNIRRKNIPIRPHHIHGRTPGRVRLFAVMAAVASLLVGCGTTMQTTPARVPGTSAAASTFTGRARGGQQPVSGAQVCIYAAAAFGTAGSYGVSNPNFNYGCAATDASGEFSLTSRNTCTSNAEVYLLVQAGNAGAGVNNNLAEMAALGPCGYVTSSSYIEINELTTVASVYALAQFFNASPYIASTTNNLGGMAQAFADVNQLTDINAGTIPGPALPAGATFPTAKVNTLANIVAACVNSTGGTAGDHSACGNLFAAATPPGGAAPTDTVTALANVAQNPALNVSALFNLAAAQPAYMPSLTQAPNDWLLAVKYKTAGISSPSAVAADGSGNIWVTNKGGNSMVELSHAGMLETTVSSGFNNPTALALDLSGNLWVAQSGTNSMTYVLANGSSGTPVSSGSGGLNLPSGIAVDPAGNVWVSNAGANTITELNSGGTPVNSNGYTGAGIVKPLGIAISPH